MTQMEAEMELRYAITAVALENCTTTDMLHKILLRERQYPGDAVARLVMEMVARKLSLQAQALLATGEEVIPT